MSVAALPQIQLNINYDRQTEILTDFFQKFRPQGDGDIMMLDDETVPKYKDLFQRVANREENTIIFDLDDLFVYERQQKSSGERLVVDHIMENTAHYFELLAKIIDSLLPAASKTVTYRDEILDILLDSRRARNAEMQQELNADPTIFSTDSKMFPTELTRRYSLYIKPMTANLRITGQPRKVLAAREVRGSDIGKLITIRGIITRVSDVKPSVQVVAYTCDKCGNEIFQEVKSQTFTPLGECPSRECKENNSKGQLFQSTRASKFVPFQDVRIQELSDQVPVGQIPRSLTVALKGTLVRSVSPGDLVDLSGILLPKPYTGLQALKAGLLTDTFLEAQHVYLHKKQYNDLKLSDEQMRLVNTLHQTEGIYERLAGSIAPEIWGHEDVKKALLLLLVGGVTKEIGDGMRIRGDINICLMGDPGVAKSQLLKFITKIAPRGVYTTGRGSSGVGLTAAVIRDPVTDEMVLEGGALVLADNGVCCIDEFDKMDDSDRTAIHEVMEQQTISIAKAGMATTLNARTSILAAANPIFGRYNVRASPTENMNLPAALLSRFDLLFLILDKPSETNDKLLAEHVTFVHMNTRAPQTGQDVIDPPTLREYIAKARTFRPNFPVEVAEYASQVYVQMRQREKLANEEKQHDFGHITPRALLGILRLAQAHARVMFREEVTIADVDEAIRLEQSSKMSLFAEDARPRPVVDRSTVAYRILHEHFENTGTDHISRGEAEAMMMRRNLTQADIDRFYDFYCSGDANQFYLDGLRTTLYRTMD